MNSNNPTTQAGNANHRAVQFEKLALHWAQRGDLRQAALALRRARLEAQTALLERHREEELRGGHNAARFVGEDEAEGQLELEGQARPA